MDLVVGIAKTSNSVSLSANDVMENWLNYPYKIRNIINMFIKHNMKYVLFV